MFAWLKKYLPTSLYGRAALIVLVPLVSLQLVVSAAFLQRHFEDVTLQMTRGVVQEGRFLIGILEEGPSAEAGLLRAQSYARALGVDLRLTGETSPTTSRRAFYDISGRTVIRTIRDMVPEVYLIDLAQNKREVLVRFETDFGEAEAIFDRRRVSASNPHQLLVLMIAAGLVLTAISFIFLRNQLRPIKRLARASEAFGKGRVEPYHVTGAEEVRAAGRAFLEMRERIERQIEQRTLMLSGVSHDLRTPLTRMKLELSLMPPSDETDALRRDLAEMEKLINAFLDFARADATEDTHVRNPIAMAQEAVSRAQRGGGAVSLGTMSGDGAVMLRPTAVERALDNLIGNALRYGETATVSVALTEDMVVFTVEDDGPGIPEDKRTEAMQPFSRLDKSRNQNLGSGVGLGLAIAADVARSHGGQLTLGVSDELGGLRADLALAR